MTRYMGTDLADGRGAFLLDKSRSTRAPVFLWLNEHCLVQRDTALICGQSKELTELGRLILVVKAERSHQLIQWEL